MHIDIVFKHFLGIKRIVFLMKKTEEKLVYI